MIRISAPSLVAMFNCRTEEPAKSTKAKKGRRPKKATKEAESGSDDEYTPGMEVDQGGGGSRQFN